jgi:hypothetical protein
MLPTVKCDQIYLDCKFQINLLHLMYVASSFAHCYHSVNVIRFTLAQSDHIKWLSLYYIKNVKLEQILHGLALSNWHFRYNNFLVGRDFDFL